MFRLLRRSCATRAQSALHRIAFPSRDYLHVHSCVRLCLIRNSRLVSLICGTVTRLGRRHGTIAQHLKSASPTHHDNETSQLNTRVKSDWHEYSSTDSNEPSGLKTADIFPTCWLARGVLLQDDALVEAAPSG